MTLNDHLRILLCLGVTTLLSFSHAQSSASRTCQIVLTDNSPFLVSNATSQGSKEWENFRKRSEDGRNTVSHYIPKGTVVKQVRPDGNSGQYLAVEVISPATENQALLKGLFKNNAAAQNLPKVEQGERGFIYKDSLEQTSDFIFVVSKESDFFSLPAPLDEARAFKLSMKDGLFEVNRCCDSSDKCEDFPIFKVMLEHDWLVKDLVFDHGSMVCQIFEGTRPIRNNQFDAVDALLKHPDLGLGGKLLGGRPPHADDLYHVDARGFVMLPHILAEGGEINVDGPYGSYHHTGSGGSIGEQFGEDAYLSPWAACGFMAVLREWQNRYPECDHSGCGIGWGNCSHAHFVGKTKASNGHFGWPHASHTNGHCIDIKLVNKTKEIRSMHVDWVGHYDRERTTEFIRLAQHAGATTIYLQDPKAANEVAKATDPDMPTVQTNVPPHKDHVHVCFSHRLEEQSSADPKEPATNDRLVNVCKGDAMAAKENSSYGPLGEDVVPRSLP